MNTFRSVTSHTASLSLLERCAASSRGKRAPGLGAVGPGDAAQWLGRGSPALAGLGGGSEGLRTGCQAPADWTLLDAFMFEA